jgi:transcriptional regulator with XRE-family HTH domain
MNTNLRTIRQAAGITQVELAEGLGVAQHTISGWESGLRTMSPEHLLETARFLGCIPEDILPGHFPAPPELQPLIAQWPGIPKTRRAALLREIKKQLR